VPREFWFVQIPRSWLGINPKEPPIDTYAPSQRSKYKLTKNQSQVEARFLYTTLLGEDVFPFGYRTPRIVALPIQPSGSKYELWNAERLLYEGYIKMYKWVDYLESEWKRQRGIKAKQTLVEWINHRNKLTAQNPQARYLVLYPDIQRISCALVIEPQQVVQGVIQREKGVPINGFVVESVLYYCETDRADEAHYLAAVLNAPEIDRRLGGLRQRQQKSHPHVAKKDLRCRAYPAVRPKRRDPSSARGVRRGLHASRARGYRVRGVEPPAGSCDASQSGSRPARGGASRDRPAGSKFVWGRISIDRTDAPKNNDYPFSASAPPTTSAISLVMAAWRRRFMVSVSS
jgi:hypothetical protein